MKKVSLSLAAAGLLLLIPSMSRADLFNNSGFETGNFSSWTLAGVSQVGAPYAHSGAFGASLGEGILSQSVTTTAGHEYDISFWMRQIPGGAEQVFSVTWGNTSTTMDYGSVVLGGLTGFDPIKVDGWQHYQFRVLALSTIGTLKFEYQTQSVTYPNNVNVDDFSVNDSGIIGNLPLLNPVAIGLPSPVLTPVSTYVLSSSVTPDASPVPEPSTYGLVAAIALGGAIAWRRRR